jgi:subtilisin family serine protease
MQGCVGTRVRFPLPVAALCAFGLAAPASAPASPDRFRPAQWGLDAVGAPEAWHQSAGAGIVVAVVDSGVDTDHPDLAGSIWTNPDEVANGVDDDDNGFVDDLHGASPVDDSADVTDRLGHGTHIAGIVAARAGNGIGGAGVAPQASIMPVKVFGENGTGGDVASLAAGIRYAVSEGARIVNVSVSAEQPGPELREAVSFAGANGATVVTSAGNNDRDIDPAPIFPASYSEPAVLSVTAVGEQGDIVRGANFGAGSVDLAAPGAGILSTVTDGRYELRAGTSMAAPFVAGSLALLAAARPDLSQAQLREALLAGADLTPHLTGKVGAGRLDVGAAMHRIVPGAWGAGPQRLRVRVRRPRIARVGRRLRVRWQAHTNAVARWVVSLDGRRMRTVPGRARHASIRARRRGPHRLTIAGYDRAGRSLAKAARRIRVRRA